MIWLLVHPSPLDQRRTEQEDWEIEPTCWQEKGKGGGIGAESYDCKKAWSCILLSCCQLFSGILLQYYALPSSSIKCKIDNIYSTNKISLLPKKLRVSTRKTREGWLLLTVETEVNGDKHKWKGSFLGWFFGLVVPVQEIFVLSWLL
jgi:hypothetical protein